MKNNTYGFAVGSTGRILYQLKNIDCCYLVFSNNLDKYIEMLLHDQPQFIVGIGWNDDIRQDKIVSESANEAKENLASLKINELIDRKELLAKYMFYKIPRNMKPWNVAPEIDRAILEFCKI